VTRPGFETDIPTIIELPEDESEYRVWQCKNCGATVLAVGSKSWGGFSVVDTIVVCCETPNIDWAPGADSITLYNDEAPEPEFTRRSRIELALEDIANG
jgi:hypothetical protein